MNDDGVILTGIYQFQHNLITLVSILLPERQSWKK